MLICDYMENNNEQNLMNINRAESEVTEPRLDVLIKRHLMSSVAQTIEYDGKDRVGYERVVCGHSPDDQISFSVSATYHSDFIPENSIGLKRRDFVEVVFIDRKNKTKGALRIIKSDNEGTFISSELGKNLSDNHINFWDNGGGLRYHPVGPEMNKAEIQKVSDILQSGIDDRSYTEKALRELNKEFPHTKVNNNLLSE